MTRAEMLARMSSQELDGWLAYDRVFGLGDNLELLAVLATLVAQAAGSKKARPGDFVPYFGVRPPQSAEDMLAMFRMVAVRHNRSVPVP